MARLVFALLLLLRTIGADETSDRAELQKRILERKACERNHDLPFCHANGALPVIPPPLPAEVRRSIVQRDEPQQTKLSPPGMEDREERTHIHISRENANHYRQQQPQLSAAEVRELREKCARISPIASQKCAKGRLERANLARCQAFFRDCAPFFAESDPLSTLAHSFNSGVDLNLGTWGVKGIPYYPVNEEGAIGSGHLLNAPFGAWGGGFSQHIGVRDYWSQWQEAGGNWAEGKYGYKSGWSVPLVQSLGVEGGEHHTVGVPLDKNNLGKINVDNGYGVGGYYQQNDHVGVNWRRGDVAHTFGVGAPIAGVGFLTGQAVTFPSLDTWAAALGKR